MFKRIMLTLTFVAAFSAAGVGFTNKADAWRYWGRPYAGRYYYAPRTAYYYRPYPYRAYYAPRVYQTYYPSYYAYPDNYYGYFAPQPGISVSFGF